VNFAAHVKPEYLEVIFAIYRETYNYLNMLMKTATPNWVSAYCKDQRAIDLPERHAVRTGE